MPDEILLVAVALLLVVVVAVTTLVIGRRVRQLQRSLEMKERRLMLALSASRAAIFEYDPSAAAFVYAQDFSQVTAGFDPAELPALEERYDWWLERVHPEDAGRFTDALRELARGSREERRIELRVRHRNEDWIHLDVYLYCCVTDRGDDTIVGILRDVTESRVSEVERRELSAQVAQSNRLEALGRLAGGVAHDFNNLLTVINGNVELARDSQRGGERDALLGEVRDAGEKASALTRQLLQFSRREPGPKQPVEINGVVAAVEQILRRLIGATIEFKTDLDSEAGCLLGDPSQIEQVLFNLVTNARDALPRGGTIGIATEVAVTADAGRRVVLRVSDDGVGMSEAVRSHIFDPFFSTKPRERGSGLGLSTVYGIVAGSGGEIRVTSDVGRGTEFRITWPQVEVQSAVVVGREIDRTGGEETILVVEDDASVARFIRTTLEQSGYGVLEAGDGEEALAALRQSARRVSLVVSDVVMPRMGGFELAESLRRREPSLPVVLVSGFAEGRPRAAAGAGPRLLDKPFSREELLVEVRTALDRAAP